MKDHPEGAELHRLISKFGRENTGLAVKNSSVQASVAWMVSNCLTESNREGFVEDLRRHIDIDIYGSCYKGEQLTRIPSPHHLHTVRQPQVREGEVWRLLD